MNIHDLTFKDFEDALEIYKDLIDRYGFKVIFEFQGQRTLILYNK